MDLVDKLTCNFEEDRLDDDSPLRTTPSLSKKDLKTEAFDNAMQMKESERKHNIKVMMD